MNIGKEHIDLRICDVEKEAKNTETFREFIIKSEKEFGLVNEDVDNLSSEHLNLYIIFLDDLWLK